MAGGYLDNPEATAATFRSGWVYPGDRGMIETDGVLSVVGRVDDVINRGGIKLHPQALEAVMRKLGDLRDAAVFGIPDGAGATQICAAVVPVRALDGDAFHARCRAAMGDNAPAVILHMAELPRNANGKVVRSELVRITLELHRQRSRAN
jgi:acyl-coenzyme A synthetase/AMP-(fatty) acid ligase